jgi:hypothetical protein
MNHTACPRCGLTDFEARDNPLTDAGAWTQEFLRRCEHVQERRHRSDLLTHTCPHWATAMQATADEGADPTRRTAQEGPAIPIAAAVQSV